MNKVLRLLVLSDLFILSSFGLVQPILAVFLVTNVAGATVAAIGIAATIQMFTKATFQIWIAKWADEEKGNCRELYTLIAGSFIIAFVPLGYAMATKLWEIYITQFFYGFGQALSFPSWRVIFTRYTDSEHAGFQWGLYDTVTSFGVAASAAIGGFLAQTFSFRPLFIIVSIFSIIGALFLVHIFNQEYTCRVHFKKNI